MQEKTYLITGLCVLIISIASIYYTNNDNLSTSTVNSDSVREVQEPTIDTTAVNISRAYDRNEIAANQEYTGRKIRVAGIVTEISSAYDNTAQVSLETDNRFRSVLTSGDRNFDAKAAGLYKGQSIRMTCIGAGEVMGKPVLNNCVIP